MAVTVCFSLLCGGLDCWMVGPKLSFQVKMGFSCRHGNIFLTFLMVSQGTLEVSIDWKWGGVLLNLC